MTRASLQPVALPLARRLAAACAVWLAAPGAGAQTPVPLGGEFQVNTYTLATQEYPAPALRADGELFVVWHSNRSVEPDRLGSSIQGQRYDRVGNPIGGQFLVNTHTDDEQRFPDVAGAADGFVVVWESWGSSGSDSSYYSIQGQRYDGSGSPSGGEWQVNTHTTGFQTFPSVAANAAGDFVVVWHSGGSPGADSSDYSVQGQRFDGAGAPVGSQFQINTYAPRNQFFPEVAMENDGDFAVVWTSDGSLGDDSSLHSVQGRRYDSTGSPKGSEFQVNTYTTAGQAGASVAATGDGAMVVAWSSNGSFGDDASGYSVQARRYDSDGQLIGSQFQVNSFTSGNQVSPSVAIKEEGDFLVVWRSEGSLGSDSSYDSIQGRRFDAEGNPVGAEFQINTYTTGSQAFPEVVMGASADFVVAWRSLGSGGSDASSYSVQARRFMLAACSDAIDNDGDSLADHPDDPGCASASDPLEKGRFCGLGHELALVLPLVLALRRRRTRASIRRLLAPGPERPTTAPRRSGRRGP